MNDKEMMAEHLAFAHASRLAKEYREELEEMRKMCLIESMAIAFLLVACVIGWLV